MMASPVARIYDSAFGEARRYQAGGVDGPSVENHGDMPFEGKALVVRQTTLI